MSFLPHNAVTNSGPSQQLPSMVSHSLCNVSMFSKTPEPIPDLWSHLVEVHRTSFRRSIQRKREREEEESLCSSFGSLSFSRKNEESIESSFKKLCLNDLVPDPSIKTQMKTTSHTQACSVGVKSSVRGLRDAAGSDAAKKCVARVLLEEDCSLQGKEDGSQSTCQRP